MGSAQLKEFVFQGESTVKDLLNEAGIDLQPGQKIVVKGNGDVNLSDSLVDGAVYFITTDVKGGI